MKRLILGLFMIFGMAVSVASAEELNDAQQDAKKFIEEIEAFKAKYPKSYNACMSDTSDSKYYYDSVCDYLFENFTALKWNVRENGERYAWSGTNWWFVVKKVGEEEAKKRLLKYGMRWLNGASSGVGLAESFAKTSERR